MLSNINDPWPGSECVSELFMSGVFLVDFPLLVQRCKPGNEERGEVGGE